MGRAGSGRSHFTLPQIHTFLHHHSPVAQLAERSTVNRKVRGSNPRRRVSAPIAQLAERALSKRKVLSSILSGSFLFFLPASRKK